MEKKFRRCKEDFDCDKCKVHVVGSGYTNHCPKCLYSKHVDINPGDRAENCRGIMAPVQFEKVREEYVLSHKCLSCGHVKKNKMEKDDDFHAATKIGK